jgi:hypothetical protein
MRKERLQIQRANERRQRRWISRYFAAMIGLGSLLVFLVEAALHSVR